MMLVMTHGESTRDEEPHMLIIITRVNSSQNIADRLYAGAHLKKMNRTNQPIVIRINISWP